MSHDELRKFLEPSSPFTHSCPECTKPVNCDVARGKTTCWCFTAQSQIKDVEWEGLCLCPSCLKGDQ